MDIFIPIIVCVIVFVLFSLCGYCCKKHRGTVYGYNGTPVAVTQVTTTVQPPYPINPQHPTPQQAPPFGFVPVGGYQTTPYPPPTGPALGGAPYPLTITPYPPAPSSGSTLPTPPPSYTEAVRQDPVAPPPVAREHYSKQAPYNPNY